MADGLSKKKQQKFLRHTGVLGMHWGERRYQYEDGTLTPEGRRHYGVGDAFDNHKQFKSNAFANALRTPLSKLGYTKKESFFFDDDPIWEAPVSHLNYERPEAKKKKTAWDRYKEKLEEESIWF